MQFEVKVGEFLAFTSRQSREKTLRYSRQVCFQLADTDEILAVSVWGVVIFASNELIFYDKRLTGPEVASVVERDGLLGRDWCALMMY